MKKSPTLLEKVFHQQCLDIIKVSFKEEEKQVIQWILEFLFFILSCTIECYYNEKDDLKEGEKEEDEEGKNLFKDDVTNINGKNIDCKEEKETKLINENGNENNNNLIEENNKYILISVDFIESNIKEKS